jgi:hypothetical protein
MRAGSIRPRDSAFPHVIAIDDQSRLTLRPLRYGSIWVIFRPRGATLTVPVSALLASHAHQIFISQVLTRFEFGRTGTCARNRPSCSAFLLEFDQARINGSKGSADDYKRNPSAVAERHPIPL